MLTVHLAPAYALVRTNVLSQLCELKPTEDVQLQHGTPV